MFKIKYKIFSFAVFCLFLAGNALSYDKYVVHDKLYKSYTVNTGNRFIIMKINDILLGTFNRIDTQLVLGNLPIYVIKYHRYLLRNNYDIMGIEHNLKNLLKLDENNTYHYFIVRSIQCMKNIFMSYILDTGSLYYFDQERIISLLTRLHFIMYYNNNPISKLKIMHDIINVYEKMGMTQIANGYKKLFLANYKALQKE